MAVSVSPVDVAIAYSSTSVGCALAGCGLVVAINLDVVIGCIWVGAIKDFNSPSSRFRPDPVISPLSAGEILVGRV